MEALAYAYMAWIIDWLIQAEQEREMEIIWQSFWLLASRYWDAWQNRIIESRLPKSEKWIKASKAHRDELWEKAIKLV